MCINCSPSARLEVKKAGQFFTVEDREKRKEGDNFVLVNDIQFRPHVKTVQNVKSVLGECWDRVSSVNVNQFCHPEIMAWFKHVKNLRTQTDLNHFLCYLVSGEPSKFYRHSKNLLMQPTIFCQVDVPLFLSLRATSSHEIFDKYR